MKKDSRYIYIDILRIISVFAVVILHVSAPFVDNLYNNGVRWWWVGNLADSATRWCVPILIMISGKLLLDNNKDEGIFLFLRKRLIKILIPLIVWSFIYMIWHDRSSIVLNSSLILTSIKNIYEGNVHIHLWYLYMIIGLYLITPIIKTYLNNAKRSSVIYFIIAWFVSNGIIGFLEKFNGISIGVNLSFFHWSIGYYILGFFLGRENLSKSKVNKLHLLGFIGLIVTIFGTYVLTRNNDGNYGPHFYSYFAPNVILMTISVFLLVKNIDWNKIMVKGSFINDLILSLNKTSFGIYLVHLLVLDIISSGDIGIAITPSFIHPIIGIPLVSLITFIISHIVVIILQKIPILNKIVPR